MSTKRSKIRIYNIFCKALSALELEDKALYSWSRNRTALTHALAARIQALLPPDEGLFTDMAPVLYRGTRILNPDIIVHDRKDKQILCLVCRNGYLTEPEQLALIELRKASPCDLVLGLSFMTQKNYMLIYIASDDKIEYYHFDRILRISEPVRQKSLGSKPVEDNSQLTFS